MNVVIMEMEFENVVENIGNAKVSTTAAIENVGQIERVIHVFKERAL